LIEKPRREFTKEEFQEHNHLIQKSLALYPSVRILQTNGNVYNTITTGTPDITCSSCNELPAWCEGNDRCTNTWKNRALDCESRLRQMQEALYDY